MEDTRRMNILVLGNSGAGKSTLIKAISGAEVQKGITKDIEVYESDIWPINCIDTKGFEYSYIEQMKTIQQVKKFTKEQVELSKSEEENSVGIDAVWYCISGTEKRIYSYNIKMMNKSIKTWKNVPVFVIITKSFSETDIKQNMEDIEKVFANVKNINLKKMIPVLAEAYPINDDIIVEPKGIDELCNATLDCLDEAKQISEENRKRMILEQKRFTANTVTTGATAAAVVVGAAPTSFADSLILVPLETGLTKGILKVYGVEFSGELVTSIVGSAAITNVAKAAVSSLKTIPNIAGSVLNAVVAGFFVAALGEAVIALSEAIYIGKIDKDKIDSVVNYVTEKLTDNAILGSVINYFENNSEKLQGKSAKEIFATIDKFIKQNTKSKKK